MTTNQQNTVALSLLADAIAERLPKIFGNDITVSHNYFGDGSAGYAWNLPEADGEPELVLLPLALAWQTLYGHTLDSPAEAQEARTPIEHVGELVGTALEVFQNIWHAFKKLEGKELEEARCDQIEIDADLVEAEIVQALEAERLSAYAIQRQVTDPILPAGDMAVLVKSVRDLLTNLVDTPESVQRAIGIAQTVSVTQCAISAALVNQCYRFANGKSTPEEVASALGCYLLQIGEA